MRVELVVTGLNLQTLRCRRDHAILLAAKERHLLLLYLSLLLLYLLLLQALYLRVDLGYRLVGRGRRRPRKQQRLDWLPDGMTAKAFGNRIDTVLPQGDVRLSPAAHTW